MTLLGIVAHHTPAAASEISQIAVALASLREAVALLTERGRPIDIKTLRTLTYHFANQARALQQDAPLDIPDTCAGKRCAVSVDGGRIRIRTNKRGPRTTKKRTRFKAEWREPKLLHIWLMDETGRICREFAPWIDGTLNGPDAVFMLLAYYLNALDITSADQILFIADGAPWIWNRVPVLMAKLNLNPEKVHQMVDFYHAVEHLNTVSKLCKRWPQKRRLQWVKRMKTNLWKGRVAEVVDAVKKITRGRNGKLIVRERNYFLKNIKRMQYAAARELKLPIGSGPMESAIRRVVNLRLKGAGIFWHQQNAEAMIMLRSYYKAGRWNQLVILATSTEGRAF